MSESRFIWLCCGISNIVIAKLLFFRFDIIADIKNQVRKREKALDVGDWISWFYSGTDEITEFRREQKLHEMRCGNPHYQVS